MNQEIPDLSGQILSERYQLLKRVGEGAMGSVYLARHTFMHKEVAVKVLHPQLLSNKEVVERFQREAQAAAHISHPNVCVATDFGQFGEDSFFLVMEWLDGKSLDELLASEDLSVTRALHIGRQIAEALERAHELGIIHRDLKPANIMLVTKDDEPDFVKVTDFGVARVRLTTESTKLTQAGMTYGTPSYMAPEQATGEEIDTRADLYSLGVVLFEMVTGRVPFTGGSIAQVLAAHVTEAPPRPSEVSAQNAISPELERLILSCLAKSPAARPQSARELRIAIERLLDPPQPQRAAFAIAETIAAPSTVLQKFKGTDLALSKSPRTIGLLAAVLVAVISLFVGAALFTSRVVSDQVETIRQTSLAEERARLAQQPDIAAALEKQAKGEIDAALNGLLAARLNHDLNPHFHFLLGSAHFKASQGSEAIAAFSRAAELEPLYASDPGVRTAIHDAFTQSDEMALAASQFLTKHWDKDFEQRITDLAENDEKKVRERTEKALKESALWEKLPRWQQLMFELRNTRKCKDLEALLDEAEKFDRDKMLSSYRYIDDLPKRGCGFLRRDDCYSCVRSRIEALVASD